MLQITTSKLTALWRVLHGRAVLYRGGYTDMELPDGIYSVGVEVRTE